MVVYNLSIKINKEILEEWIEWQNEEHIPEIMATGLFTQYKFFRLLEPDEDPTYVIQYFTDTEDNYHSFVDQYETAFTEKAFTKWKDGFIAFRSVMKSVN